MRGKSALFRLVVRNGLVHFVRKVFARRKLLPGKFWVFVPLIVDDDDFNKNDAVDIVDIYDVVDVKDVVYRACVRLLR